MTSRARIIHEHAEMDPAGRSFGPALVEPTGRFMINAGEI